MKFFHVYNEECFKGLEKNGLLNKDTGFKIQHAFSVPKERKFNNIAAIGGELHSLIKENNIPFYVDRITGGITYYPYAFDKKLIREYDQILGDWFLGFQMHESASNIRGADWPSIIGRMGSKGPYDLQEWKEKMSHTRAKCEDGTPLYGVNYGGPEYYAPMRYAETYTQFLEELKHNFSLRLAETDGKILPVDSYYMLTKLQLEMGMNTFMPEVGAQIPLMRQEIALTRGMATAAGKTWGAYYECWRADMIDGKIECCMPCFNLDPINEWYLKQEHHGDDFSSHGPNGGSSRRLQERIYYYSLMSGADYFSEEWGLNCSYTDMQDFTLSAYGQTKKDFIHAAEDIQDVKAVIPFAIVLPKDYFCMEIPDPFQPHKLGEHKDTYMRSPLTAEEKEYFGHIEDVLKLFFARNGEISGNEGHVITNSRFGDIADIIYEDASDATFRKYEYLIDATKAGTFAAAKAGSGLKILESADLEKLANDMDKLIAKTMPVYVDGLCWLVSTDNKGRRFLSIFNNEGNTRTSANGDTIDHKMDRKVKITFNVPANVSLFKAPMGEFDLVKTGENAYSATVPAADFLILEF